MGIYDELNVIAWVLFSLEFTLFVLYLVNLITITTETVNEIAYSPAIAKALDAFFTLLLLSSHFMTNTLSIISQWLRLQRKHKLHMDGPYDELWTPSFFLVNVFGSFLDALNACRSYVMHSYQLIQLAAFTALGISLLSSIWSFIATTELYRHCRSRDTRGQWTNNPIR